MRRTPGRLILLARWVAELASAWACGGGEAGDSRASTEGEFSGGGWVSNSNVTTLSHRVLVRTVSAPSISVGSSSCV